MGHPVIIGIFVAYFAIVLGLGYMASRTQKNMTDFIVAGRQMGPMPRPPFDGQYKQTVY